MVQNKMMHANNVSDSLFLHGPVPDVCGPGVEGHWDRAPLGCGGTHLLLRCAANKSAASV